MAYENYNYVSWTNGTPLTGERLAQMSTNIEQVKAAVDDKSTGIIRFNQVTASVPNSVAGWTDFVEREIVYLRDDSGTGGSDRRVTIPSQRYYKVTVNIPDITIRAAGAEDSRFTINLYNGTGLANTPTKLAMWEVTPHTYTYIDTALAVANITNHKLKTAGTYLTKIGGGTFSILLTTANAAVNQNFFASVARVQGASANNAPGWYIFASAQAPIQLYVEDVGGI